MTMKKCRNDIYTITSVTMILFLIPVVVASFTSKLPSLTTSTIGKFSIVNHRPSRSSSSSSSSLLVSSFRRVDDDLQTRRIIPTKHSSFLFTQFSSSPSETMITTVTDDHHQNHDTTTTTTHHVTRRNTLLTLARSSSLLATPLLTNHPLTAAAAASPTTTPSSSPKELLIKRLRRIPTFAIVSPTGIPYMIVKKGEGTGIGYFFLTLDGARQVLQEAIRAAKEGNYDNVWADARIVVVPLDVAMKLSLTTVDRVGQNGVRIGTINNVVPSVDAINDANAIDNTGRYTAKGRVPLFYVDGLELASSTDDDDDKRLPVYFNKAQLVKEWNAQHPDRENRPPPIRLLELTDTFSDVMASRSKEGRNMVFVPMEGSGSSIKYVKENGGGDVAYKIGDVLMVGGI